MSQSTIADQRSVLAGTVPMQKGESIISRVNGNASRGIAFGTLVIEAGDAESCLDIVNGTGKPAGVTVRTDRYAQPDELDENDLVTVNTMLGLLKHGNIAVITEDAVTDLADPVRVRHDDGVTEILGGFLTGAVSGETVPLVGAEFASLAGAGEVILVRLSGPISFGTPDP